MKKLRCAIVAVATLLWLTSLWATYVDTGWIKYTQPNGVTFVGRAYGDEFEFFLETEDGYQFLPNDQDGYYYYAKLNSKGDYEFSKFKVAIDGPKEIPKHLERSSKMKAFIAEQRAKFEDQLTSVQLGASAEAPVATTYTLKLLLVEFQDIKHRTPGYTFQNFNDLFFSSGTYNNTSPDGEQVFGSVRDYYNQMSDGDLTIAGYVLNRDDNGDNVPDWLVLDYNKSTYHNNTHNLFSDAINKANAAGLNTSTGTTTKLVVIYAGNWRTGTGSGLVPASQPSLNRYRMSERLYYNNQTSDPTNAKFSHIGINCHEFGHLLGFPDLYGGGKDHAWDLMNIGDKNGPTGVGGRSCAAPAPINPQIRLVRGWITTQIINGSPQRSQADYDLENPEVFQINVPNSSYRFLIENRHFQDGDFNSYLPSAFPSFVSNQGILVWRTSSSTTLSPDLIPADNDFHHAPNGTASQGDHGDFFPGKINNRLFAPTTVPSSWPSDDDVAFQIISDNGTSFTVDFYNSNAPNPPPAAPTNLVITNYGQNGQHPILQWSANSEPDLDYYAIYRGLQAHKLDPISWSPSPVATTSNTTWTDTEYTMATSPSYGPQANYRITAIDDADNESAYSNIVTTRISDLEKTSGPLSGNPAELPEKIALRQNYPNPFNPSTEIRYQLPNAGHVSLVIFNITGQTIRTLVDEPKLAGYHSILWDGRDGSGDEVASGIYIYRFSARSNEAGGQAFETVKKMTLLR